MRRLLDPLIVALVWCCCWCTRAEAVRVCPEEEAVVAEFVECGRVVRGGTAGAVGDLSGFTVPLGAGDDDDDGCCCPTCNLLRSVTNSVLKLRRRCCRCTASFDDDASAIENHARMLIETSVCPLKLRMQLDFLILILFLISFQTIQHLLGFAQKHSLLTKDSPIYFLMHVVTVNYRYTTSHKDETISIEVQRKDESHPR